MPDSDLFLPVQAPVTGDLFQLQSNQPLPARNYSYLSTAEQVRDYLENLGGAWGGIGCINSVPQTLVPLTPTLVVNWTHNMPALRNTTPAFGAANVTVLQDGDYLARANLTFSGPIGAQYMIEIFQNGVFAGERTTIDIDGTTGNAGQGSVEVMTAAVIGDVYHAFVTSLGAVTTVTLLQGQLTVHKLGNQPPP